MEEDIFKMNWSFLQRKNRIYYLKWAEKKEKALLGGRIVKNLGKRWDILGVFFLAPPSQQLFCNLSTDRIGKKVFLMVHFIIMQSGECMRYYYIAKANCYFIPWNI